MTVIGSIKCDACGKSEEAPPDGSYPQDWGALTFRSSRPTASSRLNDFRDKRRWFHICTTCGPRMLEFMGIEQSVKREKANDGV